MADSSRGQKTQKRSEVDDRSGTAAGSGDESPRVPARPRARLHGAAPETELSDRQAMVLRALVAAYVGRAGPVASKALSYLMPTSLSSASIRNTLGELQEAGLVDKAHASSGRVPTELGLRFFIEHLLEVPDLGPHHQRLLERAFEGIDAGETPRHTSHLLSEHTRQLGFVVAPRAENLRLRTLHLVPVSTERVLAVLVAETGVVIQRIVQHSESLPPRALERVEGLLAERVAGRTLVGLRRLLEDERDRLKGEADDWMRRAWTLGLGACRRTPATDDLVIATRLTLLDQPEFSNPERIRALFSALETNQQLLDLLRKIAQADGQGAQVGLSISLGAALGEPSLRDCALVAMPYGRSLATTTADGGQETDGAGVWRESSGEGDSLGVLGVIGPQRMDYGRVIPLVSYCSELLTRKLHA